jgi:hypothetical protein
MNQSSVPPSIYFESEILTVPRLDTLGIDEKLYLSSNTEPLVTEGQWINRGDKILEIRIHYFPNFEKPRFFWQSDDFMTEIFELKSPVAGLVLFARRNNGTSPREDQPFILVPKDEPPLTKYIAQSFFDDVSRFLVDKWFLLLKNKGGLGSKDYIRKGEFYSKEDIAFPKIPLELPELIVDINSLHIGGILKQNANRLRSEYLDLRDKLLHLVKG